MADERTGSTFTWHFAVGIGPDMGRRCPGGARGQRAGRVPAPGRVRNIYYTSPKYACVWFIWVASTASDHRDSALSRKEDFE
jgi:hypothetical protein